MQNNSLPISFDLRSVRRKYGLTVLCLHDKMQISKPIVRSNKNVKKGRKTWNTMKFLM